MTDHDVVSVADLKTLAEAGGPCVTLAASIPNPAEIAVRLKKAVRAVTGQVDDRSLTDPIEELAASAYTDQVWANTLLLFRSHELFRYYWLRGARQEMAIVNQRFHLRQLLSVLTSAQSFYLLALNRKKVQLLHCTPHAAEEIDLRGVAAVNLDEWLNISEPDHTLDNRSTAGPSLGSMKGVLFGIGRENGDDDLRHFWKQVDRGVGSILRGRDTPLVLAGVDYEVAIYRLMNTYPHLLEQAVHGAPDGIMDKELQERAWQIAGSAAPQPFRKAMEEAGVHRELGTMATDARQVVKAAFEGRVADLFFSDTAERRGSWDEANFEPRIGTGDDDLLNAAAVETIRHGGRAFELNAAAMPVRGEIAAVLRF
jgi:hypothetical protein